MTFELEPNSSDFNLPPLELPGGVHCVRIDKNFTIEYADEGYLELLGRARGEMQSSPSFAQTVYEPDRENLLKRLREQAANAAVRDIEEEYRCLRPDGSLIWVRDKARLRRGASGACWMTGLAMDVTASREAVDRLRINEQRYRIILSQTEDVVFEWDLEDGSVRFSPNWQRKFGRSPIVRDTVERAARQGNVHPDDAKRFLEMAESMRKGAPYAQEDIRLRRADGSYIWCRIRVSPLSDGRGRRAVGVVMDIDDQKCAEQALLQKAQRDPLTRIFNKDTARALIEEQLSRSASCQHALFVIDVDDFKSVNDTLGHLFGDAVLSEFASRIEKLFREGDVVGRVGGDEFIVFMMKVPHENVVIKKAEHLISALGYQMDGVRRPLSASVGAALYPRDGTGYHELFRSADAALYAAKRAGKNRFQLFDRETAARQLLSGAVPAGTEGHAETAVYRRQVNGEHLSEHIFRILYGARDINSAIQLILEIAGRFYNVSRAYVFENMEEEESCRNTFEWCAADIEPQMERLQNVPYAAGYRESFDDNGIFYCSDIKTLSEEACRILCPQNIRSMLQCAILDDGVFSGFVGFDECAGERLWTQDEIDALSLIAAIVSTFIMKKRAQERLREANSLQKQVLDNMNAWTYVVEEDSYRLLYLNQKTKALAPHAKVGARCYSVFFSDRDRPCERCPMIGIRDADAGHRTMEIENKTFGVWSSVTAAPIRWNNRRAVLICCSDITPYKKS